MVRDGEEPTGGSGVGEPDDVRLAILRGLVEAEPGLSASLILDSLYGDERGEFANARSVERVLRAAADSFHERDGRWHPGPDVAATDPATGPAGARATAPVGGVPVSPPATSTAAQGSGSSWVVEPAISTTCSADIVALEGLLRERLRGRRLVAEAGIDARLHEQVTDAVESFLRRGTQRELARAYPRVFVTFLVGHGIYRYDGGLWHSLPVRGMDNAAGPMFEATCRHLGLEDFTSLVEAEGAMRYVAPIVAHGGIPKYCLDDFFRLVTTGMVRVGPDADALLAYWRTRRSAFVHLDRPVGRFLLYGGDLAADILDRCVDAITTYQETGRLPTAAEIALPNYLIVGLARFDVPHTFPTSRTGAAASASGAKPHLILDPWSPLGPEVRLPAVAHDLARPEWQLLSTGTIERTGASTFEERRLPVAPARSWTVELTESGVLTQEWAFEGFDAGPALYFDPRTGEAAHATRSLASPTVWAVAPADTTYLDRFNGDPVHPIEELPDLTGEWSGFTVSHLDLGGVTAFTARSGDREATMRVRPRASQPEVCINPIERVVTLDGRPVFGTMPTLQLPAIEGISPDSWRIRCLVGAEQVSASVSNDLLVSIDAPMANVLPDVTLTARGPLGADVKLRFAVVTGLKVHCPDRLLFPGDQHAPATIEAPGVSVASGQVGERVELGSDVADSIVTLHDGHTRLDLRVRVPRLVWSIVRHPAAAALTTDVETIRRSEVVDGVATAVMIQTGQHDLPLQLLLVADGQVVQRSDRVKTGRGDGRWMFDLALFRDTIRTSTAPRLELQLTVGVRPVTVLHIKPEPAVSAIGDPVCRMGGGTSHVTIEFTTTSEVRGRVARLWSLDRPWDRPVIQPIADVASFVQIARDRQELPPGGYLVEIDVDDPWTTPKRPTTGTGNVRHLRLGSPEERATHAQALVEGNALDLLEHALVTGRIARRLTDGELRQVGSAALGALLLFDADVDRGLPAPRGLTAAAALLCAEPEVLARAVTEQAGTDHLERSVAVRLGLRLQSHLRSVDLDEVSDADLHRLWGVAPSVAVVLDTVAQPAPERASRVGSALGWEPSAGLGDIATGEPVDQRFAGAPVELLRSIRSAADLVPSAILDLDSYVAANFEWLIAMAGGDVDLSELLSRHGAALRRPRSFPAPAQPHLSARTAPRGTVAWASFPCHTLAASLATMEPGAVDHGCEDFLNEAAGFAPRLVERDLVLARIIHLQPEPPIPERP